MNCTGSKTPDSDLGASLGAEGGDALVPGENPVGAWPQAPQGCCSCADLRHHRPEIVARANELRPDAVEVQQGVKYAAPIRRPPTRGALRDAGTRAPCRGDEKPPGDLHSQHPDPAPRHPARVGRTRVSWLVTGGAGYIGAPVVRALTAADLEVVVLDDLSTGESDRFSGSPWCWAASATLTWFGRFSGRTGCTG